MPLPLPSNISLDETPDYLTWKTPGGNTIRMPYREQTLEHHSKRLGTEKAKKYLAQVATGVGEGADEKIREYQESFFNQHPHIRQALIGGGTGALVGALAMAHAPSLSPRHLGLGLLGSAGIGALLGQLGDTSIRKGPETMEFLPEDGDPSSPVSHFYHESPTELRNRQHMDEVEDFNNYQRRRNFYKDLDRSYYHHGKYGSESGAWQRAEGKNPEGGLNAKGRASLKAQGHDIKPGVKGKADTPEKKRRKGSFLSRMFGPGAPGSMKKDNGEPSRRALSAKAWGEPVPQDDAGRARLYAKGQSLLKSYEGSKKEAMNRVKISAMKEVLARYKLSDLKQADIDKLIRGNVMAVGGSDRQSPAEEASIEDRLSRVFDAADSAGPSDGTESSQGALPSSGMATV